VPAERDLEVVSAVSAEGDAIAGGTRGSIWVRRGFEVVARDVGIGRGTIRGIASDGALMLAMGSYERVVGPLVGIPENIAVGGAWGRLSGGLSWTAREGLSPHFHPIDFDGQVGPCSICGFLFMIPYTEWRTVTAGHVQKADYPDLFGIPQAAQFSRGIKSGTIYAIRADEGFDFNASSATGFFGSGWRAWAWRQFTAAH
jgi:hypothetical protein